MRRRKGYFYSELAIARESAISLAFGTDSKVGRGVRKIYIGIKRNLQVYPNWRQLAWESYRQAN